MNQHPLERFLVLPDTSEPCRNGIRNAVSQIEILQKGLADLSREADLCQVRLLSASAKILELQEENSLLKSKLKEAHQQYTS